MSMLDNGEFQVDVAAALNALRPFPAGDPGSEHGGSYGEITPVGLYDIAVAMEAAGPVRSVLDVGSGAGLPLLAFGAYFPHAVCTGIEIDAARAAAAERAAVQWDARAAARAPVLCGVTARIKRHVADATAVPTDLWRGVTHVYSFDTVMPEATALDTLARAAATPSVVALVTHKLTFRKYGACIKAAGGTCHEALLRCALRGSREHHAAYVIRFQRAGPREDSRGAHASPS